MCSPQLQSPVFHEKLTFQIAVIRIFFLGTKSYTVFFRVSQSMASKVSPQTPYTAPLHLRCPLELAIAGSLVAWEGNCEARTEQVS